ncbi:MAG: hypothetical protein ACLR23_03250 [Clostridia bacterium]
MEYDALTQTFSERGELYTARYEAELETIRKRHADEKTLYSEAYNEELLAAQGNYDAAVEAADKNVLIPSRSCPMGMKIWQAFEQSLNREKGRQMQRLRKRANATLKTSTILLIDVECITNIMDMRQRGLRKDLIVR